MFKIGDYVIADHTHDDTWDGCTFVVRGFSLNLFNEKLVRVSDISNGSKTVFYPHELSWEDGTRPTQ